MDSLVFRFKLLSELLKPSAAPMTADAEGVDPGPPPLGLRGELPNARADAACSLQG